MVAELRKPLRIWLAIARMVVLPDLISPWSAVLFIIGKVFRFIFFFAFLFAVLSSSGSLAGYSREEVILFFLVFNLVDITIQFLFRGVYTFRYLLISGAFDLDLLKPLPSYFRPLFGRADFMDLTTLIPLIGFFIWFVVRYQLVAGLGGWLVFLLLFGASLLLGFAFHLLVCSVGILTTEVDYLILVYRDLTAMARFPTDIYQGAVRFFITFIFPVVLLMAFPAKGLLGLLSFRNTAVAFIVAVFSAWLSLKFWYWSLRHYSSASS